MKIFVLVAIFLVLASAKEENQKPTVKKEVIQGLSEEECENNCAGMTNCLMWEYKKNPGWCKISYIEEKEDKMYSYGRDCSGIPVANNCCAKAVTPVCDDLSKLVNNCEDKGNLYCLDAQDGEKPCILELRILCANLPKDARDFCYKTVSARCYEACYKKKQYNF